MITVWLSVYGGRLKFSLHLFYAFWCICIVYDIFFSDIIKQNTDKQIKGFFSGKFIFKRFLVAW